MNLKHPKFKFIFVKLKTINSSIDGHNITYPEIIYENSLINYIRLIILAWRLGYRPKKTDYLYVTGRSEKKLEIVWVRRLKK